jgi:hypothetical protein
LSLLKLVTLNGTLDGASEQREIRAKAPQIVKGWLVLREPYPSCKAARYW